MTAKMSVNQLVDRMHDVGGATTTVYRDSASLLPALVDLAEACIWKSGDVMSEIGVRCVTSASLAVGLYGGIDGSRGRVQVTKEGSVAVEISGGDETVYLIEARETAPGVAEVAIRCYYQAYNMPFPDSDVVTSYCEQKAEALASAICTKRIEAARQKEEERQESIKRLADARQKEQDRQKSVMAERKKGGLCVFCGGRVGLIAKVLTGKNHKDCQSFRD